MEQADPLSDLFAMAKQHRIPMAVVCKRASPAIDPTTPSRWKRGLNGANLDTVKRLNEALAELVAEQAAA